MVMLLVNAQVRDEYADYNPAVLVDLDKELVDSLLRRIEAFKELVKGDSDLSGLSYWAHETTWIDLGCLDSKVDGIDNLFRDPGDPCIVLDPSDPMGKHILEMSETNEFDGGAKLRVEAEEMDVCVPSIGFTGGRVVYMAHVRHTSVKVESEGLCALLLKDMQH